MKATQHESKLFIKLSRGLRLPNDSVIMAIHKASSLRACVISWIPQAALLVNEWILLLPIGGTLDLPVVDTTGVHDVVVVD